MTKKEDAEVNEYLDYLKMTNFQNVKDEGNEFLEEYVHPKRFSSKFWLRIVLLVVLVLLAFYVKTFIFDRVVDPKILLDSIEVYDINSQWVMKEKVDTVDFKGVIMVPQVSFRVRNIGKADLEDVYFMGVFRLANRSRSLGEDFRTVFNQPLKPGTGSEPIVLTSDFGFRSSSVEAFDKNPKEWKDTVVQFFVRSGGTQLVPLKTYTISRRVEGVQIDIKITDKTE